ncbi:MAG TPA: class I SAM-dependent methyltransferase [Polyangiaceae bacterium]|nr:class I SAM-dependent methyltransferase [Polyangiaceae bacterium]
MVELNQTTTERNEALYGSFWEDTPDFVRYNPGARHRRRILLGLLAGASYRSVLDVGCGDGTLLRCLRSARRDVDEWAGADLSAEQVERNRRRMPDIAFYRLDLAREALDRSFDVVLCSEVIEHIDEQGAAMRHLSSMVSPGGRLVVTCPTGTVYPTERHFGHVHHPTPEELTAHGRANGLQAVSVTNWGWPTYGTLKWATNVNAAWSLRTFANGAYSPAAKLVSLGLYLVTYLSKRNHARGCQLFGVFEKPL